MWRRLPTYFPNLRLSMLPLSAQDKASLMETGWLREVAFKCEPSVNKLELKAFLESVHGMKVERVSTINYQGRKYPIEGKGRPRYVRKSDWKKAYVIFAPPNDIKQKWLQERQERQYQRLLELKQAALHQRPLTDFTPAAASAVARDAAAAVAKSAAAAIAASKERRRKASKVSQLFTSRRGKSMR